MAAFEDFCIVCDKQCSPNNVYCSDECRRRDEEKSYSPTLSVCSSMNHSYNGNAVVSPLLTPQAQSKTVPSNQEWGLSYESPMLSGSKGPGDLDSNKLDLNDTLHSHQESPRTTSSMPSNVADMLDNCTSENYRRWLSIH